MPDTLTINSLMVMLAPPCERHVFCCTCSGGFYHRFSDFFTSPKRQRGVLCPALALGAGKRPSERRCLDMTQAVPEPAAEYVTRLSDADLYLFNEGSHFRLYNHLGAHPMTVGGVAGTYFAVWAPSAERVAVMGDFNFWDRENRQLQARGASGVWEGFIPGVGKGANYKYYITSRFHGYCVEKADPFGWFHEVPPRTASVVWDLAYTWGDERWMAERGRHNSLHAPLSVYEVHLGSWRRVPDQDNRWLSYREIAGPLAEHCQRLGFTHVELLPILEHPFFASWGYQVTGYFSPTSRYGTPQDLMYLIDYLHQHDIGVILDWVPAHFPTDGHALSYFDGTHLFEHSNPQQGMHRDWNTAIFNFGRHEVVSFLISSALFWLDKYHIDGLRVDAVASMLYLDYSRKHGEWIPNRHGGRENLEAIEFLKRFNHEVYRCYPDVQTSAEESTAWPMVSRPTYLGGLGFGIKWDMGWMHDTLKYFGKNPIHRRYHHHELTFRMIYAFNENFILPLSHDEVVHGKGSLLNKMPGDFWQKFANLRLLYGYQWAMPGKKLLFMGGEIGQWSEWNHDQSLDWHLMQYAPHQGLSKWISDLNRLYREEPALHDHDFDYAGFEWLDANDADQSVFSFMRKSRYGERAVVVVLNCTPVIRQGYRLGVPHGGYWRELLNSDAQIYCGSGVGNGGGAWAWEDGWHGRPASLFLTLPPLSALFLQAEGLAR
jgi:1,4-alpha-glucan branching enzyme